MVPAAKPKPVYKTVKTQQGFGLHANDVPMKTPAGNLFAVPTEKVAEAIADEWRVQTSASGCVERRTSGYNAKINPASMPLMQLAATALDIIKNDRARIIDGLIAYIGSELLCHRAEQPEALKERQQKEWQPVLDWCAHRFDATLQSGPGIMPIKQSAEARRALQNALERYDDFHLVGLRHAVDISGSLILGLALIEKYLTAEQVLKLAELDALFQMQKWGEDEAILQRHKDMGRELEVCERWFRLLS